jgi:hypothetical protein
MSLRAAVVAVTTLLTLASCTGPSTEDRPSPAAPSSRPSGAEGSPDSPISSPSIRLVEEHQADLHLWVSNQAFKDDPVVLTVSIDGTVVVAQPFEVKGQHTWILFPIEVPPGLHVLHVVSGTGVEIEKRFTLPKTGRRYAVIDYWNSPEAGGRHLSWLIQSTPIRFA